MELDCPVTPRNKRKQKTFSCLKICEAKPNSGAEDRAPLLTMKHPFPKNVPENTSLVAAPGKKGPITK